MESKPEAETENVPVLEAPPVPPPPDAPQSSPTQPAPHHTKTSSRRALTAAVIAVLLVTSLVSAAALYSVYNLTAEVSALQTQLASLASALNSASTTAVSNTQTSLSALYAAVKDSVVTIECKITYSYSSPCGRQTAYTSTAQGSGFVTQYNGQMVIVTNSHVIEDASSITVTFADGSSYTATVLGTDASNDLAVLSTDAPTSQYQPLAIVSSSTVRVGDAVAAIGSPYGLAGTMTTGIISALDRTITVSSDTGGSYDITGLIQTSAPINSGNSGGPLLTYSGEVIGITTAIVGGSDGLGFAVTSDTILSVLQDVVG
ncbi:MAG: trypsin-like peptidase domain-containing protein [Candidatus Bathyarchaeota archaeon]|nr:trypsin-like peptidase domain-containing protein [Candidatus Bathyarchaeota archaeon]